MRRCRLGRTGLDVSVVAFGGIGLPQVDEAQACEAIRRARAGGIDFIDTARNYRDSERKIGAALKGRRDEFVLATKSSQRDADSALRDLETSLKELGTDRLDLWQLHNVMDEDTWTRVMGPGGAFETARRAKDEGIAAHIGITIHRSLPVMRKAVASGAFETILLYYNPLDEEGVGANGVLELARERGMGVMVMKALSGGALALPIGDEERAEKRRASAGAWFDPVVRGSLRYVLSNPAVDVVLVGMRSAREVEENLPVGDLPPLTDAERDELIRRIGAMRGTYKYEQDCLRCGYCERVCPQGIPIPRAFHALYAHRHYTETTRHIGREIYESLDVSPRACTRCETCLADCPAGIPIPERLAEVVEEFTASSDR